MQVVSKIVSVPKIESPTTSYIEQELAKNNIKPLRWAIVGIDVDKYVISVADMQK